jgi:hypothetical protein
VSFITVLLVTGFIVLASLAKELFSKNKELHSRLKSIEELGPSFAKRVSAITPPALARVIQFNLHLDEVFWRQAVKCTEDDLALVAKSIMVHSDLFKWNETELDEFFYADIHVNLEMWRDGHARIEVKKGIDFADHDSINIYPTWSFPVKLWEIWIDDTDRFGGIVGSLITLKLESGVIRLFGAHGRFGTDFSGDPLEENVFLRVPLSEAGLADFAKPDYKIKIWEEVYREPTPWLRHYRRTDRAKGLAWQMWVHDVEMYVASQND